MHKEPVFKAAVWVVFFWVGIYNIFHPFHLVFDASDWIVPGLTVAAILIGAAVAFWLSIEKASLRIDRLKSVPYQGMVPSIGEMPVHLREARFDATHLHLSKATLRHARMGSRESVQAAFQWLRDDPELVPPAMRRSEVHVDGIDLDAIEAAVLAFDDPYVAVFDKVLRVFIAHKDILSTYEMDGHGRRNGVGGTTLLQHALLVCQCALRRAPTFEFHGMYSYDAKGVRGNLVYPLRDKAPLDLAHDPIVLLAALSHDIGKIECYVWKDGEPNPSLTPNHDMIGARMLGRMPELWNLPRREVRGALEDDRTLLMTVVAFYHHPAEQPMVTAPRSGNRSTRRDGFGDVMIRSDRQVAIMELLIEVDKEAGAIEHDKVALQSEAVGGQGMDPSDGPRLLPPSPTSSTRPAVSTHSPRPMVSLTPELVKGLLWEAVEMVLAQQGRINATFVHGSVTAGSFGLLFQLPHWGGTTLILKESDFVNAVIETSDLPEGWKRAQRVADGDMDRANMVAPATSFLMRLFAERKMLVTPPGMPEHSPETSLWKIAFHTPTHVYPGGDFSAQPKPEPTGKPDFRWGSTIILRPGDVFPHLAEMEGYSKAPVCIGERVGAAGRLGARKAGKAARRSILDDESAILATTDAQLQEAVFDADVNSPEDIESLVAQITLAGGVDHLVATGEAGEEMSGERLKKAAQFEETYRVFADQLEAGLRHGELDFVPADETSVLLCGSLAQLMETMAMRKHYWGVIEYAETHPEEGARIFLSTRSSGIQYHAVILRPVWFERRGFEPVAPNASARAASQPRAEKAPSPQGHEPALEDAPMDVAAEGVHRSEPQLQAPMTLQPAEQETQAAASDHASSQEPADAVEHAAPVQAEGAQSSWQEQPEQGVQEGVEEAEETFAYQVARTAARSPGARPVFDLVAFEAAVLHAMRKEGGSGLKLFRLDDPRNGEDVVVCSTPVSQLLPKIGLRLPMPPVEELQRDGFGLTPTKDRGDLVVRILPRWLMDRGLPVPERDRG